MHFCLTTYSVSDNIHYDSFIRKIFVDKKIASWREIESFLCTKKIKVNDDGTTYKLD